MVSARIEGICPVILALLIQLLILSNAVAQTVVKTPQTLRVALDNAYAPYSFQSDEGKLQGILIDQRWTLCHDKIH
jgi:hypothetical protein